MSGSMSVHSLIDKFSEDEPSRDQRHPRHPGHARTRLASPVKPEEKPRPDEGTSRLPASASTPHLQQAPYLLPQRPLHFEQHPPYPPRATLDLVLGPQFASIPLTEANLVEALRLRSEQERSRQEQLRLELALRNLAILQTAIQNEVPPHMIPSMCVGSVPESRGFPDHQKRPSDSFAAPDQSHSSQAPTGPGIARQDHDNASSVAPLNYRFGSGSRRPLSPAKIGAAAVANLSNPITPYRPAQKTILAHQRHFSMPAETPKSMDRSGERSGPRTRLLTKSHLQLPLGATSSIQVKPSPAQPLHKQARMPQPPSQESMTSFQHVIQFHHWKPENPGQPERSPERTHKRHKSGDMSVDLGHLRHSSRLSVDLTSFKREDPDVLMDTSDVTLQEPPKKQETDTNSETSQSLGRFPHDILLTN
ncbi:hypothetical protein C7M61_000480 [Candidozyma pseudohaemuli]|uniref:Uncharacterized protein n=1 Tax=Candidozyma pseudohaemuli TaxID=418784 RepID=A0A2P7YY09_9ASCO|nr:hypothetical protein C7M61_000480 [[Candida] pseudohaemulonii]PSK40822.1 hypothetical protein C7M61_000480 [[Candida] pseudohaemulonii]